MPKLKVPTFQRTGTKRSSQELARKTTISPKVPDIGVVRQRQTNIIWGARTARQGEDHDGVGTGISGNGEEAK